MRQFELDAAEFEVVCGGQRPSFVISVAKKKPTAQMDSDSDDERALSESSDENDEDRAIKEAKEASKRKKNERRAEARRERKNQKEAGTGGLLLSIRHVIHRCVHGRDAMSLRPT